MADSVVVVTVSGQVGVGKSRVCLEIEIALRAVGCAISWTDADDERAAHEEARAEAEAGWQPFLPGRVIIQEVVTPGNLRDAMKKMGFGA